MEYSHAPGDCQPTPHREVDELTTRIARWLWPYVCVLCRRTAQPGLDICSACDRDLPVNELACPRCAMPLGVSADACGACLRRPPFFHAAYAPFRYDYPVDWLIHGLKYRREGPCGAVLGALLARRLLQRPRSALPQAIIPMPLSAPRYRQRGFNQAYELARPLRAALAIDVRADLVVRQRETMEQAGLKQKERRRNVRGAFVLRQPLPGGHFAILDDVITTGSTTSEVAKVLLRGGATRVEVWAVARTAVV